MSLLSWFKAVYETFGTPYPRASLVAVMIISAFLGGGAWLILGKQVQKDRSKSNVSGPASTSGDNSPANTGNGNEFKYDESSHSKEQKTPK